MSGLGKEESNIMRSVAVYACLFFVTAATAKNIGDPCDQLKDQNTMQSHSDKELSRLFSQDDLLHPYLDGTFAYVNCSFRGLTEVPKTIPKYVQHLDLSGNMITHIRRDDFALYSDIVMLHLDHNCMSVLAKIVSQYVFSANLPTCHKMFYIDEGSFSLLKKLKILNLSYNHMSQAPSHLPPSIEVLRLEATYIGLLTTDYVKHLPNLKEISLALNCLPFAYNLCPGNFTLPAKWPLSLQRLHTQGNILKKIPTKTFPNGLKTLYIGFSGISTIYDKDFETVPKLEKLHFRAACCAAKACDRATQKPCSLVIQEKTFMPLTHLTLLDLSYNGIGHLPQKIFTHNLKLESLILRDNYLHQLPGEGKFLSPLQALEYLDISGNFPCLKNRSIEDAGYRLQLGKSFAKLYALKELYIGPNPSYSMVVFDCSLPYVEIDENTFIHLAPSSRLETISISNLCVGKLAPMSLKHFPNLKTVYAAYNQLGKEEIKGICNQIQKDRRPKRSVSSIFWTQSLAKSLLANSAQETDTFGCDFTQFVDYSYCSITSVKQALLPRSVSVLDLSNNNLQYILNDDLKHLQFLCRLYLLHNPLSSIYPQAINKLRYLKFLLIQNTGAPTAFDLSFIQRTSSYFYFRFRGIGSQVVNTLMKLPTHSGTLPAVEMLDVSDNFLYALSFLNKNNFGYFSNMRALDLQKCQIKSPIPSYLLLGVKHLESLDLRSNELTEFPSSTLKPLNRSLLELRLDNNKLYSLNIRLKMICPLLIKFTVSNNQIRFISKSLFSFMSLQYVDLSNNAITHLGEALSGPNFLSNLKYFDIRFNPFDCSCQTWTSFFLWYASGKSDDTQLPGFYPKCTPMLDVYYGGCISCHSPLPLRGSSVLKVGINTSCESNTPRTLTVVFSTAVLLFLTFGLVFSSRWFSRILFARTHKHIRSNWFAHSRPENTNFYLYHAFIVYDLNDEEVGEWVDTRLLPAMRDGQASFNMLVIGRDISCGAGSAEQIAACMEASRRTLLIVNENFEKQPQCRYVKLHLLLKITKNFIS